MTTPETTKAVADQAGYRRRIAIVWGDRAFRWYWISVVTQALALGMQFLVIGWLVLEITGSSAQLGLVISLYGIPNVSILLVAGVVADRFQRRYVLMTTQAAVAAIVAALAFLTVTDLVLVWHVYAAAVLLGVTQGVNMPARTTMIGDLVEEHSILDGVALNSAAMQAGSIIGPPLAGAVIEVWGLAASLFVIVGCYFVSVICVAKIGRTRQSDYTARRSVFSDFIEGLTYVKNSPLLLTIIIVVVTFGAFGMAHNHIVPAMAKDVMGTGAAGIGLLFLGSGIGAFIGSLILPMIQNASVYRSLLFSLVIFTLILTLFAWMSSFWVSWVLFLFVGLVGKGLVWPLATTVVQLETPIDVRGRVMGVLHITPAVHYLGAYPLALAAGQWDWGFAITGSAMISLFVTVWFAVARRGAPTISRQAAG